MHQIAESEVIAIRCCKGYANRHVDFGKQEIFRYFGKLQFLGDQKICNHALSAGANNFYWFVLSFYLFDFHTSWWMIGKAVSWTFVFQFSWWCNFWQDTLIQGSLAQNYVLICLDHQQQWQGRSFWGTNACMRVARRVLSSGKGTTFTGREIVATSAETSTSGAKSSFRAALRMLIHCWTPKAPPHHRRGTSPANCQRCKSQSRCASAGLAKWELWIIEYIEEKCDLTELSLWNIVHFAAKPPRQSTAKNTQKALRFADVWQY